MRSEQELEKHPLTRFLREERLPHIWCGGCGNGIILSSFARALDDLDVDTEKLVIVSGIGCIGRVAGYVKSDSFHTTHGRAIALATGIKLADPSLKIVVISGDGDLFAIGGNHFIHAARRNVDMTVICSNNFNYGMTGGQFGPTTPLNSYTTTTPYGSIEHPFNLVHLASAAGAVYVARWTVLHVRRLTESIEKGLQKKGFKFIEVVSSCPEIFGRRNKLGSAAEIMDHFGKIARIAHGSDPSKADITDEEIVVGEFVDIEKPTYAELLKKQSTRARERKDVGE